MTRGQRVRVLEDNRPPWEGTVLSVKPAPRKDDPERRMVEVQNRDRVVWVLHERYVEAVGQVVWAKLDDRFPDHPKVEALSDRAFRLYIRGLCYSVGVLTDGLVPGAKARQWGSLKSIGELMSAGLWESAKGGYAIHDFLTYNLSKADVIANRERDSYRKRSGFQRDSARSPHSGMGDRNKVPDLTRRLLEGESR